MFDPIIYGYTLTEDADQHPATREQIASAVTEHLDVFKQAYKVNEDGSYESTEDDFMECMIDAYETLLTDWTVSYTIPHTNRLFAVFVGEESDEGMDYRFLNIALDAAERTPSIQDALGVFGNNIIAS